MKKTIAVLALAAATLVATPATASAPTPHGVVAKAMTTACQYEDSVNCYWDAGNAGNGQGHSFYSVMIGHKMCTIYWDRAYNRRHGYCS